VLVAEFSTAVQEQPQEQGQLRLIPNPTCDRLVVTSDVGTIEQVTILTPDGREVMRRSVRASTATLDVSSLNAGAYVLLARTIEGMLARERFIKH